MDIKKIDEDGFVMIFDIKDMFDITETTLKIYEELIRSIFKKVNGYCWSGILEEDYSLKYLFVVGNVKGVTGYNKNEFLNKGMDLVLKDGIELRKKNFKRFISEEIIENKFKILTRSGEIKWIHETVIPKRDENGGISYLLGIAFDITREKMEKDKIEERKKFFEKIFESIKDVIIITKENGEIIYLNQKAKSFLSNVSEELKGKLIYEVFVNYDIESGYDIKDVIEKKLYLEGDVKDRIVLKNGNENLFFDMKVIGFKNENGNNMIIFLFDDISREILKDNLAKRVEKLESLSLFAGGIAHNLNNLIFKVKGSLSLLENYVKDKKGMEIVSRLKDAAYSGEMMGNKLLTFARGGGCVKKSENSDAIKTLLKRIVNDLEKDFALVFNLEFKSDDFIVNYDESQLYQAIYNLVLNACEASNDGEIVISCEKAIEKDAIKISIEDNGVGIAKENLEKVFYPYFTTKKGHPGLGLSISQKIIRNHGGDIFLKQKEKGTIVEIYLPTVRKEDNFKKDIYKIENKKIYVLVMDDDSMVREVFRDMLEELNCEVDLANNGEMAIEKYKVELEKGKPYDVVFLDLIIENGLGGKETFERLKEMDPDVKAVVSSGYSDEDILSNFKEFNFFDVLKKPFDLNDLSKVLDRIRRREG